MTILSFLWKSASEQCAERLNDFVSLFRKKSNDELSNEIAELLKHFDKRENDDEELEDQRQQEFKAFQCITQAGIVTALDENGGFINHSIEFTKINAFKAWNKIKIGKKVSFMIFENLVTNIEVIEEDSWDIGDSDESKEFNGELKISNISEGFMTGVRTYLGNVTKVEGTVITLGIEEKFETAIDLNDHASLDYNILIGDILKLDCITQEHDSVACWNLSQEGSSQKILKVKSFQPNRSKHEIGRVSEVFRDVAIIDDMVVVLRTEIHERLELWDRYEYEAIETCIYTHGRTYDWRLTKLIRHVEGECDELLDEHSKVKVYDVNFCFFRDSSNSKEMKKFISIFNNSKDSIVLKSCKITNSSGLVSLEKLKFDERIGQGRKLDIFVYIKPFKIGMFSEELTLDFGTFEKMSHVTIEISERNSHSKSVMRNVMKKEESEFIPGQKLRQAPRFIEVRIQDYAIPDYLRLFDFKKQTQLTAADLSERHSFLFDPLDAANYVAKLSHSLYIEEIAIEIHFEKYRIERGYFENSKEDCLRLEVDGIAEKRPSISIGDSIRAREISVGVNNSNISNYEGIIHKVEQNSIYVKFHPDFHRNHRRMAYKIDFHFSRSAYKRQHHALRKVASPSGLGFDFLFPEKHRNMRVKKNPQLDVTLEEGKMKHQGKELNWFNEKLDIYQKTAVMNVLRGTNRPMPYIIYGPPGTGKTHTVIEIIEQISKRINSSRIIIATPSNSAANLIVERLLNSKRFNAGDFVRFVSFNQVEKCLIPPHLRKYCATIDIGLDDGKFLGNNSQIGEGGIRLQCSKSSIVKYRIIISTLSSIGPLMNIKFPRDHFSHIIIDEAGQTIETQSLVPLSFLEKNRGQVILAGDPKQLGPVLHSQLVKIPEVGFSKSFLERLSENELYLPNYGVNENEYNPNFVTKLKKNYRSLPSVLEIYNRLFYDNELEAEVDEENSNEINILRQTRDVMWHNSASNPKCGVYFVNVSGHNMRSPDSNSWYNNIEASEIFHFVCRLKKVGIDLSDVGIITPYTLQVKKIRGILDEAIPDSKIKIGSVEEFQGQERQIILVSTVRTNQKFLNSDFTFGLGFLQCSKRMNVAISRARSLLVVFGKEAMLSQDENWRSFIQITKENGTYVTKSN